MRLLLLLATILHLTACNGQEATEENGGGFTPVISSHSFTIGDKRVVVKSYQYGQGAAPVFVSLHDDETTSVDAAKEFLARNGGLLVRIENAGKRLIRFRHGGRSYSFDPNRMFSSRGIAMTARTSAAATHQVERFGLEFLNLVPAKTCIIALHNNTEGRLSIKSYQEGNDLASDARRVHSNPRLDPDDFFLTTDSSLYERIKQKDFNIVLQDNERATKDGSLSIWCGERNICYVNLETQHGRAEEYKKMLEALFTILPSSQSQ